jgi:hypothetical protein
MKQVFVKSKARNTITRTKLERDLFWYDHKKSEMRKFRGGQLVFEFAYDNDLDEYRLLPKVEDLYQNSSSPIVDEKSIEDWFYTYSMYNNTKAEIENKSNAGLTFEVPENELSDFLYDLDRNNIFYEVD